jgi:hypothetical protein
MITMLPRRWPELIKNPPPPSEPLPMSPAKVAALGKRVIGDVIEIGRRLTACKVQCGHGNWLPWLEREFGWTDETARRYINVADMGKSHNLLNLEVPVSSLYLLAAPGMKLWLPLKRLPRDCF